MQPQDVQLRREELRDHDRFVSELARRLVRDPDLAADTAQDAWAVALSRERPAHVSLRAWLAGILRNRVRSDRRDSARRRDFHERIARSEEGSPRKPGPADELVARTEMEQRVLRAVLRLDEPIRDAVLLRFREGLSSAQIGRALGIPDGTARWRIHRGIALVREQLDREHNGDREAWMPGVALIAGGGGAWTAPIIGGILAMNGKAIFSAVALIAVASVFWMNRDPGDEKTGTRPMSASHPAVPVAAEGDTVSNETLTTPVAERTLAASPQDPEPESPALQVQGRCIAPDGSPLKGVAIAFTSQALASNGWPLGTKARPEDTTDESGAFSVEIPLNSELTDKRRPWIVHRSDAPEQVLRFSRDDRIPRVVSTFQTSSDGAHLGDVVLRPGTSLRGRVTDELGRPIVGATAYAHSTIQLSPLWRDFGPGNARRNAAKTDSNGVFSLTGIPPGWVRVFADANGYFIGASEPLGVGPSISSHDVKIVLPSVDDRIIEGIAVDASGSPLAGVEIHHDYQIGRHRYGGRITCDDQGRFSARSFEQVAHTFTLRHGGANVRIADVQPGRRDVEIRLPTLRQAAFHVVDAITGQPITTFSGSVQADRFYAGMPEEERPGGRAMFSVGDRPLTIHVGAPGYFKNEAGPFQPAALPTQIVIRLQPTPELRGIVTRDGTPVAGAEVVVADGGNLMELWGFPVRSLRSFSAQTPCFSNADGTFLARIRNIDSQFYLRTHVPGFAPSEVGPFRWPEGPFPNPIVFDLGKGGAIHGSVRVPKKRSPAGILVAISRGDGFPIATRTDEEGNYRFENVLPGPWQVELRATDYNPTALGSAFALDDDTPIPSNCIVTSGGTARVDLSIRAEERCSLTGTALKSGARPGLSVSLYDCADPSRWSVTPGKSDCHESRDLRGKRQGSATVMADGTYSLTVTKPGQYVAVLSDNALEGVAGSEIETLVELVPGQTVFDFHVEYRTIEGRVTGEPRDPSRGHIGSRVDWRVPISHRVLATGYRFADRDGAFQLHSVPIGRGFAKRSGDWTPVVIGPSGATGVDVE